MYAIYILLVFFFFVCKKDLDEKKGIYFLKGGVWREKGTNKKENK